jgi:hypothetical protein
MPMPQLKTRAISAAGTLPVRMSQAKTGGSFHDAASISTVASSGMTRGTFSTSPPPVMWAIAPTLPARHRARAERT